VQSGQERVVGTVGGINRIRVRGEGVEMGLRGRDGVVGWSRDVVGGV